MNVVYYKMALSQFRTVNPKGSKFNGSLYNTLVGIIGEPMLIDDQSTFAYWYHPSSGEIRYHTISLDLAGIHCSVQAVYNIDHAKLLLKTTRRAWFEPGRELLTVTGGSLDECNALLTVVLMLIEKRIPTNEFDYFVNKKMTAVEAPAQVPTKKQVEAVDEATPGRPVGPNGQSATIKGKQTVPPPLKTYANKK